MPKSDRASHTICSIHGQYCYLVFLPAGKDSGGVCPPTQIVSVVSNNLRWPTNGRQCWLWYDRWLTVIAQTTCPSQGQHCRIHFEAFSQNGTLWNEPTKMKCYLAKFGLNMQCRFNRILPNIISSWLVHLKFLKLIFPWMSEWQGHMLR